MYVAFARYCNRAFYKKMALVLIATLLTLYLFPTASKCQHEVYDYNKTVLGRSGFTRADTLRGRLSELRNCYNVLYYDLFIDIAVASRSISGRNLVLHKNNSSYNQLQIDLFSQYAIDSIIWHGQTLDYERDGNAVFVTFPETQQKGEIDSFAVYYSGKPQVARKPPWDGGFVWHEDKQGNPWIGVACEGLGASSWWPMKDHLSDEPDSMRIRVSAPDPLKCIANGNLESTTPGPKPGKTTWNWFVSYPINSYNVTLNIGDYAEINDLYNGINGTLALDYYVLSYNVEQARAHFKQVGPMLDCFEKHFGPYPFYKDGYALVETPYWGMEHQSCIAYGNNYRNNQFGFDFIIIHETGHEWFGNNISARDHAELWIHESFTTYSEAIYMECLHGRKMAEEYLLSQKPLIKNADPMLGPYDVNFEDFKSSDIYYKGSWMLHTLRNVVNDDGRWFAALRGTYDEFRLQTVNSQQIVDYFNEKLGQNYTPFFRQYLLYTTLPVLEYKLNGDQESGFTLEYRWKADEPGFLYPVEIVVNESERIRLEPTATFQTLPLPEFKDRPSIEINKRSFLVEIQEVKN